jgi:hypothetical protein
MVFSLEGMDTKILLKHWTVPPPFFFSSGTIHVLEWGAEYKLNLRLDTNIILYEHVGNSSFRLYEQYAIKSGPTITRMIGTWSEHLGLDIFNPVVWVRRSDFFGTELSNAVLYWHTWTELVYDNQNQVRDSPVNSWLDLQLC